MEQVHSETYSLLIETYVRDSEEKDFLFNGMENSMSRFTFSLPSEPIAYNPVPVIQKKAEWALKYITPDLVSFATRFGESRTQLMLAIPCTTGSLRMRRGDLLLWIIRRYILAQEEGAHAWPDFLE